MSNYVSLANAFTMAGAELGASLPILKLTKDGKWVRGSDNTPVTRQALCRRRTQYVVRGFDCYKDGVIVAELGSRWQAASVSRARSCLIMGLIRMGMAGSRTLSLQLRSTESGEEFIVQDEFSRAAMSAIGSLLRRYGARLDIGKGGFPDHRTQGQFLQASQVRTRHPSDVRRRRWLNEETTP